MVKPGALLLLLAVAASQVDPGYLSSVNLTHGQEANITSCPITFYGRQFTILEVLFKSPSVEICFKSNSSETAQDCLVIEDGEGVDTVNVEVKSSPTNSGISATLTNIRSSSSCLIDIVFKTGNSSSITGRLYNFGTQAALRYHPFATMANLTLTAKVGNSSMGSWTLPKNNYTYADISGCRLSDAALASNSEILNPETCSKVVCNASAVLRTVSTCGPLDVCLGNNTCNPPFVCTVTGSTVVDIFSRVYSVRDRCVYRLMKTQGGSNFDLLAGFQERRRKDVPFLDHLVLSLTGSGSKIYLEQGGRVRVDNQTLTLNTAAQVVNGVELSKDQTGVTVKIPSSNATVFFDGYTAHVAGHMYAEWGLCGSTTNTSRTTTPSAEKSSSYSDAGCEIKYSGTVDSTINCNHTTAHCNLMRQAPFASCHNHTDPEPYITACTNTLCKYPAVDGLKCQFLEAYAKSCSLKSNVALGDWRSMANCSAVPQAFCQDRYCSAHEFCGEKYDETRCLCRALFASKYEATNALGEPTLCMQNSATVVLAGCLLGNKGIDYSVLHLNDQNCIGHMDNKTHMVTFNFDSSNTCGMEVVTNNSQIIYKNTITTRNSSMYGVITRHDQVEIDFSCFYAQPDLKSVAFTIKDGSVVQQIASGAWNYTLMMNAYADAGRMNRVNSSTEIKLNQKIWLELKTEGLDDKMVAVVTDSCWATNQPAPNGTLRYDLIINGCPNPADQTVKVQENGLGTSNYFSFNMFEFSGKNNQIYLHCKLELCVKQGKSCAPTCGGGGRRRRRSSRSTYADEKPALITMVWNS